MAIFKNLAGTTADNFSIGKGSNKVDIRTNAGALESRDYNGSYVPLSTSLAAAVNNNTAVNDFGGLRTNQINAKRSGGVIIPLYIYPADAYTNASYNAVIAAAKKYKDIPTVVAVNPNSGPGTAVDANYSASVARLRGAGITVIGYVATGYMATPLATVKACIDKWVELYPKIQGIWFDEVLNFAAGEFDTADIIAYYRALYIYVKSVKNLDVMFVNPGTTYDYQLWEAGCADNFTIYENSGYPSEATLKQEGAWAGALIEQPVNTKAVLVYGVTSYVEASAQLIKKYNGWMFITNQTGNNRYSVLTPYLEDMYKTLGDSTTMATAIKTLIFRVPNMTDDSALHFALEVFNTADYSGTSVETFNSAVAQTNLKIFDGSAWIAFPAEGAGNPYYDNKLAVALQSVESETQYYIRYKFFIADTNPANIPWSYSQYPALEVNNLPNLLAGGSGLTWEIITANTQAVSGKGYLIDTTSNAVTLTLPATPAVNAQVGVKALNTTNAITVARNGVKIEGLAEDMTIDTAKSGMTLVYSDAGNGWVVTTELNATSTGGGSTQEVVEVTSNFAINATNADKVISNAGATADVIGTIASDFPVGKRVRVANEINNSMWASKMSSFNSTLKAVLPLTANANDIKGSNNLTAQGSPTYSADGALLNNGGTKYLKMTSMTADMTPATTFALCIDVKYVSVGGEICVYDFVGLDGTYYNTYNNGGNHNFWVTNSSGFGVYSQAPQTAISTGIFYRYVFIANGTKMRMYRNGVKIVEVAYNGTLYTPTAFSLGYLLGSSGNGLNGYFKNFYFWNGITFTGATQETKFVSDLYNAGTPITYDTGVASSITITPATGEQLPLTAAANNTVKSSAKYDYIEYLKVSADPARWICTSAIPSATNWVDQLDGE